jgi:hypothetical protein
MIFIYMCVLFLLIHCALRAAATAASIPHQLLVESSLVAIYMKI